MRTAQRGMGLMGVLTTAFVGGIIGLTLTSMLTRMARSEKYIEEKSEIASLKQSLSQAIKCAQTIPNPAVCDGVTPVILRDGAGQPITTLPLVPNGTFKGSGKYGNFYVRATCSNTLKTMTVQIAKPSPDGKSFAVDPLEKIAFDFNRPPNPVYGPSNPICGSTLGGSAGGLNCPAGEAMTGIQADGTPNCKAYVKRYAVSDATLTAYHSACNPAMEAANLANWVLSCNAAADRWCRALGFVGGHLPQNNGVTGGAICFGAP